MPSVSVGGRWLIIPYNSREHVLTRLGNIFTNIKHNFITLTFTTWCPYGASFLWIF